MVHEIKNCVNGLAHKSKDHIKRGHQDGKCSERIYCGLTFFLTVSNIIIKKQ